MQTRTDSLCRLVVAFAKLCCGTAGDGPAWLHYAIPETCNPKSDMHMLVNTGCCILEAFSTLCGAVRPTGQKLDFGGTLHACKRHGGKHRGPAKTYSACIVTVHRDGPFLLWEHMSMKLFMLQRRCSPSRLQSISHATHQHDFSSHSVYRNRTVCAEDYEVRELCNTKWSCS